MIIEGAYGYCTLHLGVMNLNLSAVGCTLNDSPFSKCNLKINGNLWYLLELDGDARRFLQSSFEVWFNFSVSLAKIVYQSSKYSDTLKSFAGSCYGSCN